LVEQTLKRPVCGGDLPRLLERRLRLGEVLNQRLRRPERGVRLVDSGENVSRSCHGRVLMKFDPASRRHYQHGWWTESPRKDDDPG
jgi:hypothetical protein